jgi:hypothetical protein
VDLDPWGAVVVLDRHRVGTASVGAPRGGPQQCDALRDGGAAAEVRDVEHVDAASDDDLEDRLTEHFAGPLDRNGADAGDLAQLVTLDPTPHQRLDVDAQQREEARIRAGRLLAPHLKRGGYRAFLDGVGVRRIDGQVWIVPGVGIDDQRRTDRLHPVGRWERCAGVARAAATAAGELDERVEGVGLTGLSATLASSSAEELVDDRVERGVEHTARVGRAPSLQVPGALTIGEAAQPPLAVDAPMRGRWLGVAAALARLACWRRSTTVLRGAASSNDCSAAGLTAAASAIASACARDSSPCRTAASVAGNRRSRLDVSKQLRAAPTELPALRAMYSAADRSPARAHVRDSSTRAANSVLAATVHRSISSYVSHISGASDNGTSSGTSRPRWERSTFARSVSCRSSTPTNTRTILAEARYSMTHFVRSHRFRMGISPY